MDPELSALLADFPVVITLPVQWGDQDALQHVNNTVYFRWYESGRIAYTSRLGLMGEMLKTRKIGPILAAIACDYRRQITFPDTVHVGTRVRRIGRTSLAMDHLIVSTVHRAVAAEARSTLVVFDYNEGVPTPVPDAMRAAIASIEGRSMTNTPEPS